MKKVDDCVNFFILGWVIFDNISHQRLWKQFMKAKSIKKFIFSFEIMALSCHNVRS